MPTRLTKEQALALGKEVTIDAFESAKLPRGDLAACQVNSGMYAMRNPGSLYCMGFVAGYLQNYEPHAWVKHNGKYLECSPQDGVGFTYVLVKEMTFAEVKRAGQDAGINDMNRFIPPLLDSSGNLVFVRPDDDADAAQ